MLSKKPFLIKLVSFSFFFSAGFTLFIPLSFFLFLNIKLEINLGFFVLIMFIIGLCYFYIAIGIGILKRAKWARVCSIIIFVLSIINITTTITNVISQLQLPNLSTAFKLVQITGIVFTIISSCLGLYAMLFNQSVKYYFNNK
jgi:hypothetical protein